MCDPDGLVRGNGRARHDTTRRPGDEMDSSVRDPIRVTQITGALPMKNLKSSCSGYVQRVRAGPQRGFLAFWVGVTCLSVEGVGYSITDLVGEDVHLQRIYERHPDSGHWILHWWISYTFVGKVL